MNNVPYWLAKDPIARTEDPIISTVVHVRRDTKLSPYHLPAMGNPVLRIGNPGMTEMTLIFDDNEAVNALLGALNDLLAGHQP